MNEHKFNIELIFLNDIKILNASIQNNAGVSTIDYSEYDVFFQYQLTPSVSISTKKVRVIADFDIRSSKKNNESADIVSQYTIGFIFTVENLTDLAVPEEGNVVTIDDELISSLLNISYSTSRGILYTRCLGTVMDGLILPIIPTKDLRPNSSAIKSIPVNK